MHNKQRLEAAKMLTPKQEAFKNEYLIDLNATQAAIRAGYSPKTAAEQGARLLTNVKVRAHIDAALAERSRRTGVTADRVVRELARIAFIQAPDAINFDDTTLSNDASEDDRAAIASVRTKKIPTQEGDVEEREIKLYDKIKALELLGKHLGMFTDKKEVELGAETRKTMEAAALPFAEKLKLLSEMTDETDDNTG
jgi:phage terminase small subunit